MRDSAGASQKSNSPRKHCMYVCYSLSHVGLFVTPRTVVRQALCAWYSPGKNTGVGCHSLLQGIFSTQGSNLSLPHCRQIFYHLS